MLAIGRYKADLSQSLKAEPPVRLPPLTDTAALEEQGLVAHDPEGFFFCKNWDSKTMCLFFEQHLPRLFEYFKEQGFNGKNPSKLPFCVLKREDRTYKVMKPPENGPAGKFYQDNAAGPVGGSFKNRKIVLSECFKSLWLDRIDVNALASLKNPDPPGYPQWVEASSGFDQEFQ